MELDIRKTPFSRYGSYSVISLQESEDGEKIYLRDIGGGDLDPGIILQIIILNNDGSESPFKVKSSETELIISGNNQKGTLKICFPHEDYIRLYSDNISFRLKFILKKYDHVNPLSKKSWELHSYSQEVKLFFQLLEGNCEAHLPWDTIGNTEAQLTFTGDKNDMLIQRYIRVPQKNVITGTYEEAQKKSALDYDSFFKKIPEVRDEKYEASRRLASYITWSSVVKPSGILTGYAMYMSNNWMTNLWSWDNCFNAIGLGNNQPELAYNQFIIFKDFQDESGVLPDFVNDRYASYGCCKPPIHGWAYMSLMNQNVFFREEKNLLQAYKLLKGIEHYWRIHRTADSFPLPYYNHGNDSGWDNSTVFAKGCPVTSPDLPAFLVLLYEALEDMAQKSGLDKEAAKWKELGASMIDKLLQLLWDGHQFRSYNHIDKTFITEGESLINLIPIVIGNRLPIDVKKFLVGKLKSEDFLTDFGLATESVNSPFYRKNGYWRGPIWAPTTLLIIDGLKRSGEEDFARQLSRAFCDATLSGGMAENFDAKTGEGLVDPAFTWTSNVFLRLASDYI